MWAAGADDGWVSCMLCSWDRALCCTLESVLSKGAQVLWAPDPLLQCAPHLSRAFSTGLLCVLRIVSQSFAEFLSELFSVSSSVSFGGNLKKDSDLQRCCKISVGHVGH